MIDKLQAHYGVTRMPFGRDLAHGMHDHSRTRVVHPAAIPSRKADMGSGSPATTGRGARSRWWNCRCTSTGQLRGACSISGRVPTARVYGIVLQEGTPVDILTYVGGALLVDLWAELVLPRAVRSGWGPVISPSSTEAT
jgi:hypothetical protein